MVNGMRRSLLLISIIMTLSGCTAEEQAAPPPPVRPVKLFVVEGIGGAALRRFPGSISASQRAELSFRAGGVLKKIQVKEGDRVKKGQVLAQLDPTDFKIRVSDRQATFDNADKNFKRGKELVDQGAISKLDFDRLETNYRTSLAALELARQELTYTKLRAPFAGSIGRREVDNFEEITSSQPIFQLQNVNRLDVAVDLPENLIRSLEGTDRDNASKSEKAALVKAYASFEGREKDEFPLKFKEAATRADSQTQTFRVTFTMSQPDKFSVLPGMTASVFLDLSVLTRPDTARWVPISAVVADSGLDSRVWVLDGEAMTVSARSVTVGRMSGQTIEVSEGLEGGEEIVSVGAVYLSEGMQVSRMLVTEQAEPRTDDPS